jgi:hypothetical protein
LTSGGFSLIVEAVTLYYLKVFHISGIGTETALIYFRVIEFSFKEVGLNSGSKKFSKI